MKHFPLWKITLQEEKGPRNYEKNAHHHQNIVIYYYLYKFIFLSFEKHFLEREKKQKMKNWILIFSQKITKTKNKMEKFSSILG